MRAQPHRLIFLEETGTTTKMPRSYGRSAVPAVGNQTLIAGLSCDGIVAPWVISGAMGQDAFDTSVEKVLIPELHPGSVVILDNLATHKSDAAAQMLKSHGCWFCSRRSIAPISTPSRWPARSGRPISDPLAQGPSISSSTPSVKSVTSSRQTNVGPSSSPLDTPHE
jgi:hypothetical protein